MGHFLGLVVLTWNLHAGAGDLPRLLSDLREGALTGGVPPGAFVLLLQEAPASVVEQAPRDGLSVYYAPANPALGYGNAILSTLPLFNARTIELPRARQRRIAVAASVQFAGQVLWMTNVHLENRISWWRGGLFSEGARGRQARALVEQLPRDVPGVLGGDLNTWLGPREPAWLAFEERFPDARETPDVPTFGDRLFLDHLFFDAPEGWDARRTVIDERYGSDHHPVIGSMGPPSLDQRAVRAMASRSFSSQRQATGSPSPHARSR